jgi:hypothetical protein
MKFRRSLLVVALVLGFTTAVHAAALAPTKASQLATVLASTDTCNSGSGRVLNFLAQGDGSVVALAIPDKSVLVVTAWEWCEGSNPSAAFVTLAIDGPGGFVPASSVLRESLTATCSRADLGPGVRVSSGTQLCVTPVGAGAFVKAYGYFAKDK